MGEEGKESQNDPKHRWMIKSCDWYKEELSDCRSIKARFQQYFIQGETEDCSVWKRDYNNCLKWENSNDIDAANEIIESEKGRIRERLQGHYNNDVWENRKEPLSAEEWNPPLPEEISKGYANSFLQQKADAIKKGEESLGEVDANLREGSRFLEKGSMCCIV